MSEKNPKSLKTALKYYRLAMWGFSEIGQCIAKCLNTGTIINELKSLEVAACY